MGLALGIAFNFTTSLTKGLKLEVRHFGKLIPTFVEVTGGKLVGTAFLPQILNMVKALWNIRPVFHWLHIKLSSIKTSFLLRELKQISQWYWFLLNSSICDYNNWIPGFVLKALWQPLQLQFLIILMTNIQIPFSMLLIL